jgi:hypothetical protein
MLGTTRKSNGMWSQRDLSRASAKLCLDFANVSRLRAGMDEEERRDLIGRLFALLTAKSEDAAGLAAEGQGKDVPYAKRFHLAEAIRVLGDELEIVADAATAILRMTS